MTFFDFISKTCIQSHRCSKYENRYNTLSII